MKNLFKTSVRERMGIKMNKLDRYKKLLRKEMTPARFMHCCGVSDEAAKLAGLYGADEEKARFAGLMHDITKDYTPEQQLQTAQKYSIILDEVEQSSRKLWHAITGAAVLEKELYVDDPDILNAVRYHTTARQGMSLLEKIIYLADYISPDRDYEGVLKLREAIYGSLEGGMAAALDFSVREVLEKGAQLHLDTVRARNEGIRLKAEI